MSNEDEELAKGTDEQLPKDFKGKGKEEMSSEDEEPTYEQLARAFVSKFVDDAEKSVNDEVKVELPQGAKKDIRLRLMLKAAKNKKIRVTRAFAHCLSHFFSFREMTAFMNSEFPEEIERTSFKACMDEILDFGKPTGENKTDVMYVQSYLRFSAECEKNRNKGIVAAMQKDQKM